MNFPVKRQAQFSNFRLSIDKSDTLFLLLACGLVLMPYWQRLPLWISGMALGFLIWRVVITWRGKRLPSRWLLSPLTAGGLAGVYLGFGTDFNREAWIAMLVVLLSFKLLEMHARRDLFVVIYLAFFLLLAQFFYSQSIGTALLTILCIPMLLAAQLNYQFVHVRASWREQVKLILGIVLLGLPLTLILFMFFPRVQGPLWGKATDSSSSKTGMSDTMSPGKISELVRSEEIVLRVRFLGFTPLRSDMYWRGLVFGHFDGQNWSRLNPDVLRPPHLSTTATNQTLSYEVTLEPQSQRWLYSLELPITAPAIEKYSALLNTQMELQLNRPSSERLRYTLQNYKNYQLQTAAHDIKRTLWLQLPEKLNPKTQELAKTLKESSAGPEEFVKIALKYFRENEFRYTLQPPLITSHDTVDEFLFDTRAGFCEHYSGAFVALMRSGGVPARVVVGYQGGDYNSYDNYWTVRQSDAHAWAEVWLGPSGWVRVDPTAAVAPDRIELNIDGYLPKNAWNKLLGISGIDNALARQLRLNVEALSNRWNQWVLDYSSEKQFEFLRALGFGEISRYRLILLLMVAACMTIGLIALPLFLRRQKRDEFEQLYERFCGRMNRYAKVRDSWEGPHDYAVRIVPLLPELMREPCRQFLAEYQLANYAHNDVSPKNKLAKLKKLFAALPW